MIVVRYLNTTGAGPVQQEQRRLAGTTFVVGRSANAQIQLPDGQVALSHARLTVSPTVSAIAADGGALRVNGRKTQTTTLEPGDRIEIGPFLLRVETPAPGMDLELVVSRPVSTTTQARDVFRRLLLALPRVSRRRLSYLAFLATLLVFLVLPTLPDLQRQKQLPLPQLRDPALQELSAALANGLAQTWNPGPISPEHQVFFENCRACHEIPFVQVRDSACVACHEGIEAHAQADRLGGPLGRAFLAARCTQCHSEHKGRPIVLRSQERCAACHGQIERVAADAGIENAVDFKAEHPQFRLRLPDPDHPQAFKRVRQSNPPPPQLVERSHLKFNHALHLNPLGIRDPEGGRDSAGMRDGKGNRRVLECADCHAAADGGRLMAPITMEKHCRSCHSLAFEPKVSARQVPHGDVQEVATMLREFYARLVLGDTPPGVVPPTDLPRMRPGAAATYPERQRALEVADRKARRVLDELYDERGVCSTCHQTTRDPGSGDWGVVPVRINHEWMPQALFTHRAHDTQSCTTCHEVRHSKRAEDVAMPDLERCRDCHVGEQPVLGKVTSDCAVCHLFHAGGVPWHPPSRAAAAAPPRAPP